MSDDDLDWGELDQVLAKSQSTKSGTAGTSLLVTTEDCTNSELHFNYEKLKHDYNELSKKLLAAHGETSILRANLERLQSARQIDVDAKVQRSVDLQEKFEANVAELNREIEKLKSEKQFMINDQQQSLIEQKIRAKKLKHAHSPDVSPMQSPTTTPKKQRMKDLGLDFGDGFIRSPKKKRRAEVDEKPPAALAVDEGDVVMNDAVDSATIEGLIAALKASDRLSAFARIMFSNVSHSKPLLTMVLEADEGYDGNALLEGIMNGSTVVVFDILKEMLASRSDFKSKPALLVPLLHTVMITDPSVLLDGMDSLFETASHAVLDYRRRTDFTLTFALYNLDLIRSMLTCAACIPALISKAWNLVDDDFFVQLLQDPPANVFAKLLAIFALSGYDESRAPLLHEAMIKAFSFDVEPSVDLLYLSLFNDAYGADDDYLMLPIESSNDLSKYHHKLAQEAGRMDFERQGIPTDVLSDDELETRAAQIPVDAFEKTIRLRAAKLVSKVYASRPTECYDTPRLVTAIINRLSVELDRLYDAGLDARSDSSQVEACIWSLDCIYSVSPNVAALLSRLSSRATREQLVALSRVAMGEDSIEDVPDSMLDRRTVDRAVELLEQVTTSKEVEELYEFYDAV